MYVYINSFLGSGYSNNATLQFGKKIINLFLRKTRNELYLKYVLKFFLEGKNAMKMYNLNNRWDFLYITTLKIAIRPHVSIYLQKMMMYV